MLIDPELDESPTRPDGRPLAEVRDYGELLAALRARLGYRVHYDSGANIAEAAEAAQHAQVAVVVVSDIEAEGRDRQSLQLPGQQDRLIEAVEAANPRTIVVLETGSAVLMCT